MTLIIVIVIMVVINFSNIKNVIFSTSATTSASTIKLAIGDPPRRLPAPVHWEALEIAGHA